MYIVIQQETDTLMGLRVDFSLGRVVRICDKVIWDNRSLQRAIVASLKPKKEVIRWLVNNYVDEENSALIEKAYQEWLFDKEVNKLVTKRKTSK